MNSHIVLSVADHQALRSLVCRAHGGSPLERGQSLVLEGRLESARVASNHKALADHVGLYDEVVLVSPVDSKDLFTLRVVMPEDEDIDADKIAIGRPIALAAIGRRRGEIIMWVTPNGIREMMIVAVTKSESDLAAV